METAMSVYGSLSQNDKDGYIAFMRGFAELNHNLFSDNDTVYLPYRVVEGFFVSAFNATDVSREDIPIDNFLPNLSKELGTIGVGVKTFSIASSVKRAKTKAEKIAEFDREKKLFSGKSSTETAIIISELWNQRLADAKKIHGIDACVYHCVVRHGMKILLYEFPLCGINVEKIKVGKNKKIFTDGVAEYSMGILNSKSTLQRRFKIGQENCLVGQFHIDKEKMFSAKEAMALYSGQGERQ